MKAIVNGISIEGTPEEVAEYVRIVSDGTASKRYRPTDVGDMMIYPYVYLPVITCNVVTHSIGS